MRSTSLLIIACFLVLPASAQEQPNFLVIVADDMGWSDPGFLGSSINTPNIDALAARGTFLSNFYVAPTCSPTRSMLLTGVNSHAAGVGTMQGLQAPNQIGQVEYGAQLHEGVVTLGEALQAKGYATAMSGKWHLAIDMDQHPGNRGFEKSFSLLEGGASHFSDQRPMHRIEPPTYLENGEPVELPADFYSTYNYTDKIIEYIDAADDRPFFAYLAYTAPHDPLQVPDNWLLRYRGNFDQGPAEEKSRRVTKLSHLGLLAPGAKPSVPVALPAFLYGPSRHWDELSTTEREVQARRMEIYASMIEIMDQQIGRLITFIDASGRLDNTYIIFMSDNGASAGTPFTYPANDRAWVAKNFDLSPEMMGKPGSFTTMGRQWANSSNTPFRLFKATAGEGGVRSPFVITGPQIPQGSMRHSPTHVMDIAPTVMDLAQIDPTTETIYKGKVAPAGRSLLPLLQADIQGDDRVLATELFGNRMVRAGNWKAMSANPPVGTGEWELFDITADPGATEDLAGEYPVALAELIAAYEAFASRNNIIAPEPIVRPKLIALHEGPCNTLCVSKFTIAQMFLHPAASKVISLISLLFLIAGGFLIYRRIRVRRS